jgi:hypothetical protein
VARVPISWPKSEARQRRLAGGAATIQSLGIHFYFKNIEEKVFKRTFRL